MKKHKNTIKWENLFLPILKEEHKNHAKKIFHRMMKKSSTLKTGLKRRSREYEVEFNLTLEEVRYLLLDNYTSPCCYCQEKLTIHNMVCDHKVSISHGGPSIKSNLQIICARCNTRKGPLSHQDYSLIVKWLSKQNDDIRQYVNRKLAMADIS